MEKNKNNNRFFDIFIEEYSKNKFKVSGESTFRIREQLRILKGEYKEGIRGGWIFPDSHYSSVDKFIEVLQNKGLDEANNILNNSNYNYKKIETGF